jgi:nucleotide-binding universal stress UspA family protein
MVGAMSFGGKNDTRNKKILYTTDLSQYARYEFGYVASLANRYDAGITIFHVLEVENNDYDLVVMGAHGHGALADALMGSVSRRVVRRSKTPVLVVRLSE